MGGGEGATLADPLQLWVGLAEHRRRAATGALPEAVPQVYNLYFFLALTFYALFSAFTRARAFLILILWL